jgi:hypothetical protein
MAYDSKKGNANQESDSGAKFLGDGQRCVCTRVVASKPWAAVFNIDCFLFLDKGANYFLTPVESFV